MRRISLNMAKQGEKTSEQTKEKQRQAALLRVAEGRHNCYKGGPPLCKDCGKKLVSYVATRCKPCRTAFNNSGENHWAWKGGISPEHRRIRASGAYLNWRKAVLERDNYTCVFCGDRNYKGRGVTVPLQADHIKPFYLFPELRFDVENGRTLCVECHRKTPTWGRQPRNPSKELYVTYT